MDSIPTEEFNSAELEALVWGKPFPAAPRSEVFRLVVAFCETNMVSTFERLPFAEVSPHANSQAQAFIQVDVEEDANLRYTARVSL